MANNDNIRCYDNDVQILLNALEAIADPLGAIQKNAKESGNLIDGRMAVMMANDASYLSGIAIDALKLYEER